MLKVIISGCNGRMGHVLTKLCQESGDMEIVAGVDLYTAQSFDYPVFSDISEVGYPCDVVIDFSAPAALPGLLRHCVASGTPAVLCATGYSPEQLSAIDEAAKSVALFRSANMSIGINLLTELVRRASQVLGQAFDIEIVEMHHNKKVDAPSGTALMLADAAAENVPDARYVYDRQSVRHAREKNEIGISSVRGGTIPGDHQVIFAGTDEVIELRHTAYSRDIFAAGAIRAARFMKGKAPGRYDMNDVIREL